MAQLNLLDPNLQPAHTRYDTVYLSETSRSALPAETSCSFRLPWDLSRDYIITVAWFGRYSRAFAVLADEPSGGKATRMYGVSQKLLNEGCNKDWTNSDNVH